MSVVFSDGVIQCMASTGDYFKFFQAKSGKGNYAGNLAVGIRQDTRLRYSAREIFSRRNPVVVVPS